MSDDASPPMLPRYVGYAEIEEHFLIDRRSVQRLRRVGKFPKSVGATPGKNGRATFLLSDILFWDEQRRQGLVRASVSNPADLPPDELDDQARDLAARAHSKRTGEIVDRRDIALHHSPQQSVEDFIAAELAEHKGRVECLAQLSRSQAMMVVAALLPQLRQDLAAIADPVVRDALKEPGPIEFDFEDISDFLRLFELKTKLVENGLGALPGQTIFERFAEFSLGRASVLSAWLFSALLPLILQSVKSAADREGFSNPDRLRALAMAALDDNKWAKKQAEVLARQRGEGRPQAPPVPPTAGSDKRA